MAKQLEIDYGTTETTSTDNLEKLMLPMVAEARVIVLKEYCDKKAVEQIQLEQEIRLKKVLELSKFLPI